MDFSDFLILGGGAVLLLLMLGSRSGAASDGSDRPAKATPSPDMYWCDRRDRYHPADWMCASHTELPENGGSRSLDTLRRQGIASCISCRWQKGVRER